MVSHPNLSSDWSNSCTGSVQVILKLSLRVNGVDNEMRKSRNRERPAINIRGSGWSLLLSQLEALLIIRRAQTPDTGVRVNMIAETLIRQNKQITLPKSSTERQSSDRSDLRYSTNCHHNQTSVITCVVCDMFAGQWWDESYMLTSPHTTRS